MLIGDIYRIQPSEAVLRFGSGFPVAAWKASTVMRAKIILQGF
jgi:hypothetical protein